MRNCQLQNLVPFWPMSTYWAKPKFPKMWNFQAFFQRHNTICLTGFHPCCCSPHLSLSLCQDVLLSHYCRLEVSNPGGVGEVKRWLARQGLQVAVEYCSLCSSLSGAEVSPSCGIPVGTSWTGLPSFCDTKIAVLRYKISTYASYASRRSFSRRDTEDGSFLYSFSDPDAGAEKKVKNVK